MAFLTASRSVEVRYALTTDSEAPEPVLQDQFLTMETAWVDVSSMGPSKVLVSTVIPSVSTSLHLMQTPGGRRRSPDLPSIIRAALVTFPRLNMPARERKVASSHSRLSSARSGNLSENDALAARTAPGSRFLTSAPLTTLPVQSS